MGSTSVVPVRPRLASNTTSARSAVAFELNEPVGTAPNNVLRIGLPLLAVRLHFRWSRIGYLGSCFPVVPLNVPLTPEADGKRNRVSRLVVR